ncbi:MAG: hypothetical protein Q4A06_08155, partial [Cardiobacteriaceae bacterium]|nr:hypothetical protein [Cardiobacteriaceae bacterium]
MGKPVFTLQTAKPLLLASTIALALTACGGSDHGHNAPIAEKPAPAPMPDNRVAPQDQSPSAEKQPQDNSQPESKQ